MSESATATVETVIAEVHVLMVGSRQVTASVYGQLDMVAHREITPFGRVTPKDARPGYVYVIGKRKATGELVRCVLPVAARDITRWIADRSQARAYEEKARDQEGRAARCNVTAQGHEEKAAELAGDGYTSAAHYEREEKKYEADAGDKDRQAAAAESELARLEALADAAWSRQQAARARHTAAKTREEINELQAKAAQMRQAAGAAQDKADDLWESYDEWTERENKEHEDITAMAAKWSGLPLIVLAGLR